MNIDTMMLLNYDYDSEHIIFLCPLIAATCGDCGGGGEMRCAFSLYVIMQCCLCAYVLGRWSLFNERDYLIPMCLTRSACFVRR